MIEDWVEQCRRGHSKAYAKIVEALQGRLLDFLYRMTQNRELAEDLGQEAFLRAFRLLDRYDQTKAAFSTWLFTLARNLCLDELRKRRPNWVLLEEEAHVEASVDPGPDTVAGEKEIEIQIADAVRNLDPKHREVFILREYQDLPVEEIGRIVECPVGTVKSRLHRARLILQEKLGPVLKD